MLLLLPVIWLTHWGYRLFQTVAPTNRLLHWLRHRRNLKLGMAFVPLGFLYLWAAATCTVIADKNDDTGWLYLVAGVLVWNAFKFLFWGPVSLAHLASARLRERQDRHARTTTPDAPARTAVEPVGPSL